jgi:hypothetical protein
LKILTTLLAALGLAYACLWWSFERFYGEFGVSPQDVGLAPSGSASDLAGAALQLGIWLLIVLAVLAALPVAAVMAVQVGRAAWPDERALAWAAFGLAALLLAVAAFLYWWLVDGWDGLALLGGAALVFGVLWLVGRLLDLPADAPGKEKLAAVMQAVPVTVPRVAIGVALAAAVVGITFLDLPTDAAEAGRCAAHEGKSVPSLNLPFPGLHLPILSVHAQPATLTWLGGTPPGHVPLNRTVVYLGQSGGSIVVYDGGPDKTTRIPAGDVAVHIDASTPKCPGVH